MAGYPTQSTLSASQIKDFLGCPTKWGWKQIAKCRPPPNASAALGSRVHKMLEEYILGQRSTFDFADPDGAGEIAQSGVGNLPDLEGREFSVERKFHFTHGGIGYLGYVDLTVEPDATRKGILVDHKTSSNIAAYAETSASLLHDVQAQIYAYEFFRAHPHEGEVDLLWNYYQTKKTRKSLPVLATVSREHAEGQFREISATGAKMAEASRTVRDPLELPKNTDHCEAFGGCPFKDKCFATIDPKKSFASVLKSLSGNKEKKDMGLRDDVASAKPAETSNDAAPDDWQAQLAALTGGEPVPSAETPPAINRQEKDSTVPTEDAPSVPVSPEAARYAQRHAENEAAKAAENTARKAGRPKGSKNKPKAEEPTNPTDEAVDQIVEDTRELAKDLKATVKSELERLGAKIGILFINCAPTHGNATDLSQILPAIRPIVEEETSCSDYRFAEFGKGPGVLAQAMRIHLDSTMYSQVTINTQTPEGAILANVLREVAATVVVGLG